MGQRRRRRKEKSSNSGETAEVVPAGLPPGQFLYIVMMIFFLQNLPYFKVLLTHSTDPNGSLVAER